MTEKEFLELEEKYKAEKEKRDTAKRCQNLIEKIEYFKNDNPSIKLRDISIPLTSEEKCEVCEYVISTLKKRIEVQ